MAKVAVASENGMVAEHFGHCQGFVVFDTEENKIVKRAVVANPGHRPGFLPRFLQEMGVNIVIAGGMGGGAIAIFNENNIEVIVGARGNAQVAVEDYLNGSSKSTHSICHEHRYQGECDQ